MKMLLAIKTPPLQMNDARAVSLIQNATMNFNNPFAIFDKEKLYCLSYVAPASSKGEHDLLQNDAMGMWGIWKVCN